MRDVGYSISGNRLGGFEPGIATGIKADGGGMTVADDRIVTSGETGDVGINDTEKKHLYWQHHRFLHNTDHWLQGCRRQCRKCGAMSI